MSRITLAEQSRVRTNMLANHRLGPIGFLRKSWRTAPLHLGSTAYSVDDWSGSIGRDHTLSNIPSRI